MSHIAERLAISVSALTTSVNALVRKEYLCRESVQVDRRIVYVKLTEKGQSEDHSINQNYDSAISQNEEETLTILVSLGKINTIMSCLVRYDHTQMP